MTSVFGAVKCTTDGCHPYPYSSPCMHARSTPYAPADGTQTQPCAAPSMHRVRQAAGRDARAWRASNPGNQLPPTSCSSVALLRQRATPAADVSVFKCAVVAMLARSTAAAIGVWLVGWLDRCKATACMQDGLLVPSRSRL